MAEFPSRFRTVTRLAVLAVLAALTATGCGSVGGDAEAGSDGLPVVRWGYFRNYQPVYVGVARKLFEKAGVKVELTGNFSSGPAVVQAAGSGQIDAGHSAITGLANAGASGIKVVGVADSQTEFKDVPLQQWFVLDKSPVRSIKDLKGKRIGTNSLSGSFYYTALMALRQQGLDKGDVKFVVLPHDRQEQALRSGQIDVAGIIDPYTVAITRAGGVRRLFSGADVLGERQFSLVFFREEFIRKHPDVVRKFLDGYRRAIEYIARQPEAGGDAMAETLRLERAYVVPHRYTDGAAVRMADVQSWLDTMRDGGELKDAPDLAATDIATDDYNP
jgi:sulfonate transport system substrate-binding protein